MTTETETQPQTIEPLFNANFYDELKLLLRIKNDGDIEKLFPAKLTKKVISIWHEILTAALPLGLGQINEFGIKMQAELPNMQGNISLTELDIVSGKVRWGLTRSHAGDWEESTDFIFSIHGRPSLKEIVNHFQTIPTWQRFRREFTIKFRHYSRNDVIHQSNNFEGFGISGITIEERVGSFFTHSEQIIL